MLTEALQYQAYLVLVFLPTSACNQEVIDICIAKVEAMSMNRWNV